MLRFIVSHTCSQFNYQLKMVSTRKKKGQNRKQLDPSDETLIDFVIGNGTTVNTMGNETLESQADGRHEDFQKVVAVQVKTKS